MGPEQQVGFCGSARWQRAHRGSAASPWTWSMLRLLARCWLSFLRVTSCRRGPEPYCHGFCCCLTAAQLSAGPVGSPLCVLQLVCPCPRECCGSQSASITCQDGCTGPATCRPSRTACAWRVPPGTPHRPPLGVCKAHTHFSQVRTQRTVQCPSTQLPPSFPQPPAVTTGHDQCTPVTSSCCRRVLQGVGPA